MNNQTYIIIVVVIAVLLLGVGGYWWMNRNKKIEGLEAGDNLQKRLVKYGIRILRLVQKSVLMDVFLVVEVVMVIIVFSVEIRIQIIQDQVLQLLLITDQHIVL